MNARSRFYRLPHAERVVDRRGAERLIRLYTGRNKGRVYPYSSVRQFARQTRRAAYAVSR